MGHLLAQHSPPGPAGPRRGLRTPSSGVVVEDYHTGFYLPGEKRNNKQVGENRFPGQSFSRDHLWKPANASASAGPVAGPGGAGTRQRQPRHASPTPLPHAQPPCMSPTHTSSTPPPPEKAALDEGRGVSPPSEGPIPDPPKHVSKGRSPKAGLSCAVPSDPDTWFDAEILHPRVEPSRILPCRSSPPTPHLSQGQPGTRKGGGPSHCQGCRLTTDHHHHHQGRSAQRAPLCRPGSRQNLGVAEARPHGPERKICETHSWAAF